MMTLTELTFSRNSQPQTTPITTLPPILLVEPDETERNYCQQILQAEGYRTLAYATIAEGFRALEQFQPALVITAIADGTALVTRQQLEDPQPGDGLAFLDHLRQHLPEIAVILTTSQPTVETSVAALRHGAADYLTQPVNRADLLEAVGRALSAHRRDPKTTSTEVPESRTTLHTLLDGISDGLYIVDRALDVLMVNRAESERLGATPAEIRGASFPGLGWAQVAPEFIDLVQRTFATAQTEHWLPPESHPSALIKNREMHLYPIISPQGEVQQIIVLAQDVAKQKYLQATLFQSSNLAAIGQLANSIAHEINNPLTIALTNTQLTMMDLDPADEEYEVMEDIYYACDRIKNIVTNLVDLSSQDVYLWSQVNLIETLEETLIFIAHPLRKAQIEIERAYHYTPKIRASRSHLKMTWLNLLLNACEAIVAAGQKQGKIILAIKQAESSQVSVSITDNGCGIPPAQVDNVFKPFFTTKPTGQGVGLGLFIAHTIIENHAGAITFESEAGRTTFTTCLPESGPPDSQL